MRSPGSWGHRHGLPQLSLVSPLHPSSTPLLAAGHPPGDAFAGWWGWTCVAGTLCHPFLQHPLCPFAAQPAVSQPRVTSGVGLSLSPRGDRAGPIPPPQHTAAHGSSAPQ